MEIYLSLLVAVVGLLMYFVASNAKVSEVGRILFFSGAFVFLLQVQPHVVSALR
jgi:Na+/phosphate symporter